MGILWFGLYELLYLILDTFVILLQANLLLTSLLEHRVEYYVVWKIPNDYNVRKFINNLWGNRIFSTKKFLAVFFLIES